jgi:predicted signal transduction protein with EAL and GGDEF domain
MEDGTDLALIIYSDVQKHEDILLEISEQGLATATDKFYEQLAKIRENGYKLWVDDFGSGKRAGDRKSGSETTCFFCGFNDCLSKNAYLLF